MNQIPPYLNQSFPTTNIPVAQLNGFPVNPGMGTVPIYDASQQYQFNQFASAKHSNSSMYISMCRLHECMRCLKTPTTCRPWRTGCCAARSR